MVVVLVAIAALIGVGVGWALARRRAARRRPVVDEPGAAITDRSGVAVRPAGTTGGPAWREAVDRLELGVVVADAGGRIQYRNPAARALAGTHLGLLVDDTIERLLATARQGTESTRMLELYGPPRVAVVVRAVPLPDGTAVASIEDVSERRRVDAVRTDFVANISHELKTPVGALAVLAEALEEEDDIEVVKRVADRMVREAHRVGRTIDDLMELSRIELGEEPARDPVDAGDVVLGAVQRGIDVQVLDQPEGVIVTGDRRQLESALGNLVENAVKYSESGSNVQVRIRVEGRWAELMVADHGIGIPARDHDRIFERFYRVDRARSRDTGGTGLGLSIVRHVATNHGGDVLVSSEEGEGSTFVLRIPLARAPEPATAPTEEQFR
jgi:two-component system sensor histidine kinase SenX3